MNCPSCGADVPADQRYAHLVVCDYCQSAIVLDEKAARVTGKMAALTPSQGPLYVGGTGNIRGKNFSVLGRVRYGYTNGYWDEWFLAREDGKTFWVSEDEHNFTLEVPERGDAEGIDFPTTNPGETVTLRGAQYHVDEKDVAECEGGEGQLPFPILSGERVPFIDLSNDQQFATIEYELDGDTKIYLGRRIKPKDIKMDVPQDEATRAALDLPVERAGDEHRRERIVRSGQRVTAIQCEHCAAPLEVPSRGQHVVKCPSCDSEIDLSLRRVDCPECHVTVTVRGGRAAKLATCQHCHTQLDVSRSKASPIGNLLSDRRPKVPIEIGQAFNFRGTTYRVVGYVRYTEVEGIERWDTDEFLLYAKDTGYRWLIHEDGHFSFGQELDERPIGYEARIMSQKQTFRFLNKRWTVYESCYGNSQLTWVEGELPWVAQVGDRTSYMDAISPPYLLSAEWSDTEEEWFLAEYVDRREIADALGTTVGDLPYQKGIAPNQPLRTSLTARQTPYVMFGFALIFLAMSLGGFVYQGPKVTEITVTPENYKQEYITEPFQLEQAPTLCEVELYSQLNNGWVYLDLALLDDQDRVLLDFSAECSYYHGVEGGESWSEGSRSTSKVIRVDEPGEYRMLVMGQFGDAGERPVKLTIRDDAAIGRYYLGMGVLCLLWPLMMWVRSYSFEKRRWAPVIEDDDDD